MNPTPSVLLRPSRPANAVSIRITLGNESRVHGDTQTGLAGEGLFFFRRRADATSHYVSIFLLFVFQGLPTASSVSTILVPGEAESGSAGTQPDKE